MSPRDAVCLFPFSVALSLALAAAVVALQRWLQAPREGITILRQLSGAGMAASLSIWFLLRYFRGPLKPASWDANSWKSFWLALQAGVLGLFVPVYLYVWRT